MIRPRRLGTGEEVDLDLADAAAAELEVAGSGAWVAPRFTYAPNPSDQGLGHCSRCGFGKEARLGNTGRGDVPNRPDVGELCLEQARIDRHEPLVHHACVLYDGGRAMLGNPQKQLVAELLAIVEHGHAACTVERGHLVSRVKA